MFRYLTLLPAASTFFASATMLRIAYVNPLTRRATGMAVEDDDAGADMGPILTDASNFAGLERSARPKTSSFYIVEYGITKKMHEFLSV